MQIKLIGGKVQTLLFCPIKSRFNITPKLLPKLMKCKKLFSLFLPLTSCSSHDNKARVKGQIQVENYSCPDNRSRCPLTASPSCASCGCGCVISFCPYSCHPRIIIIFRLQDLYPKFLERIKAILLQPATRRTNQPDYCQKKKQAFSRTRPLSAGTMIFAFLELCKISAS